MCLVMLGCQIRVYIWVVEEGIAYVNSKSEPAHPSSTLSTDTTQPTQEEPSTKNRKLSSASREQQSESQADSSLQAVCKAEIDRYVMVTNRE